MCAQIWQENNIYQNMLVLEMLFHPLLLGPISNVLFETNSKSLFNFHTFKQNAVHKFNKKIITHHHGLGFLRHKNNNVVTFYPATQPKPLTKHLNSLTQHRKQNSPLPGPTVDDILFKTQPKRKFYVNFHGFKHNTQSPQIIINIYLSFRKHYIFQRQTF